MNKVSRSAAKNQMLRTVTMLGVFGALALLLVVAGWVLPVRAQSVEPVFGLRGVLAPAMDQAFANTLTTPNGTLYGISGATPLIEQRLTDYAVAGETVKVWGTVQNQSFSNLPIIVATSVVLDSSAMNTPTPIGGAPSPIAPAPEIPITPTVGLVPTATPHFTSTPPVTATQQVLIPTLVAPSGPTATITVYAAYVRSGPGSQYAPVGTATQGEVCRVIGRTVSPDWLQLQCPTATGWVLSSLFTVSGSVSTLPIFTPPTLTPLPPTPTPISSSTWRILGYANPNLEGPAAVTFDAPNIDFQWGEGPAHPALPVDQFSLRLDRVTRFVPGQYQLTLTYDDGARLYVNGQLVINDWAEGALRTRIWQGQLGGDVPIRIEYFDAYGNAALAFQSTPLAQVLPTATPVPPIIPATSPRNAWLATYWNNTELAPPAVYSRQEPQGQSWPLNYEFGLSSPVPGVVNEDGWSARWQGRFYFEGGDYRFNARGRDGVRVYIDGIRVINAWPNTVDTVSNTFDAIGAGEHEIAVEMYNAGGQAWVRTWWERIASNTPDEPNRDQ